MENHPIKRRQTDDTLTIAEFWDLCLSHGLWFAISLTLCLGYAFYYLHVTPKQFTCEAALLIKQESQGKTVAPNTSGTNFDNLGIVQQSINVTNVQRELTSLRVLSEVARRMAPESNEEEVAGMAERMRKRLKAKIADDRSTIIDLSYVDTSSTRAKDVLNTVIQVYNDLWLEDKNLIAAGASRFIEERLALLEQELGDVDDSISSFKMRNKITDLDRVSEIYLQQQSQSDAEILRLTNQKAMAQYILGILHDKSTQHQLLPTNSGINNAVAESLITQYNTMLLQLKNNLYGTSQQNPLIIKQESDLEDMRQNILTTISNQIQTLDIQLQALMGYSGETSDKITSNPDQAKHLVSVEREQKVKESLYLYLLQKKEENHISMMYTSLNTQVIDMPHGSSSPTSPDRSSLLLGMVLTGLLLPAAVLFVREHLDNTVRNKHDIERKSSLPLIGEIPFYRPLHVGKPLPFPFRSMRSHTRRNLLVVRPDKQDMLNEAFRFIRTHLEFLTGKSGCNNVYIVTSNNEGSGKTFVSTNLAAALAITNRRVLFIDGDLRHASASHYFHCPQAGLADYLGEKESDLESLIVHAPDYPSLDILPVGTIPPNPTELLSDGRFGALLAEVRPRYDFIFIDCPPADTLADTGIIERHADRTLFVIRAGLFVRSRIEDLDADVCNGKYKHISLILNATRTRNGYGYRYGYPYGRSERPNDAHV